MAEVLKTLEDILGTLPPKSCEFMLMILGGLNERAEKAESHLTHLQSNHTKLTSSTAALLARCVALEERARVRDTRKGEWPEEGEDIIVWSTSTKHWYRNNPSQSAKYLWLPAPPDPETT